MLLPDASEGWVGKRNCSSPVTTYGMVELYCYMAQTCDAVVYYASIRDVNGSAGHRSRVTGQVGQQSTCEPLTVIKLTRFQVQANERVTN